MTFKSLPAKKLPKSDREQAVLLGLIELYLRSGKPIGSQTLQENGFESLSSATIRNYFAKMEEQGYLAQPHTSGGRLPTSKALRLYADTHLEGGTLDHDAEQRLSHTLSRQDKEVATTLNVSAELLSELSKCAVFISTPRFDQDFIQEIRLIQLAPAKLLAVAISEFGLIRTETLYLDHPVDLPFLRSAEEYFRWRMSQGEKPLFQTESEAKLAQKLYNEVMVRHVVGYVHFPVDEIIRTGLSKLLAYPEFNDAASLASSLGLLEDEDLMRELLKQAKNHGGLCLWIGDELCPKVPPGADCSVLAVPYRINQNIVGAIGLLGPMRLPYRSLFGLIQHFSQEIGRKLTESLYKFKMTYRESADGRLPNLSRSKDTL
jgi:heat-inducible transcriptional repressor